MKHKQDAKYRIDKLLRLGVEMSDGPADRSDIRPGDFLLSVNGKPIDAPEDLVAVVRQQKPGCELTLARWRNGEESDPLGLPQP